jgi:hypothetical protein
VNVCCTSYRLKCRSPTTRASAAAVFFSVNADETVNADQEAAKSEPSSSTCERKRLPDLCAIPLCLAAPTGETSVGVSIRAASVMSLLFGDGQTVVYSIASNEEPFPGILFRETKTCGVDKLYVREKLGRSEHLGQRCSNCFQKTGLPASGAHRYIELILSESLIVVNEQGEIRRHQLSRFLGGRSMVFERRLPFFCVQNGFFAPCMMSTAKVSEFFGFPQDFRVSTFATLEDDQWLSAQSNIRYTRISAVEICRRVQGVR